MVLGEAHDCMEWKSSAHFQFYLQTGIKVGNDRPRAHSRVIPISFQQHEDEPEANLLFAEMAHCRVHVSRSVGLLVKLSQQFEQPHTKEYINQEICPAVGEILSKYGAPARFTTTMSVFMYFFLEVSGDNINALSHDSNLFSLVIKTNSSMF